MNFILLKAVVKHNIQETVEYAEFLDKEIDPLLNSMGKEVKGELQFFNNGYKAAMENVLSWMELEDEDCKHYWEAQTVEIKVQANPLTYNPPPTIAKCKHCGILR